MQEARRMANQSYPADDTLVTWADNNATWGPLLFLRPKPDRYFNRWRLACIAVVLGSFQGMAVNAGMVLAKKLTGQPIPPAYLVPLVLSVMVAFMLELSVGRAWNRRAERLLLRTRPNDD